MNSGGLAVAMRLAGLAAPIAVGRLGVVGMGLVDTIVVGQLAPQELAHLALGWTINGPALIGGVSLLLGVQVLGARAIGAGDPAAAGVFWRRGLVIALAAGAAVCVLAWTAAAPLLLALGVEPELARRGAAVAAVLALSVPLHLLFMASAKFLEALERPIPGAVAMWIANGLNLALDLALVPGGGAIGSAWATVLSRLFLAVVMAGFILRAPSLRPFRSGARAGAVAGYPAMLAIGLAAAVSGLVEAAGFAAMGVIAARAGGPVAITAWTIATGGLVTLAYLLAQGLATAAIVLVSEAVGAGELAQGRRIGRIAIAMTVAAMAMCGLASIALAPAVAAAFSADPAVRTALVGAMVLIALLMIPDGGQGTADAVLRARGDNWLPTAIRMVAFVVVAPLLALGLLRLGEGSLTSVLTATLAASLAAFAVLLLRLALRERATRGRTQLG